MGLTDAGIVRRKNEDSIGYDSALGTVVLADGMGGHRGGEIASGMTVDTVIDELQKNLPEITPGEVDPASGFSLESICIQNAIVAANELVYKTAEENPEHKGMGTTIVVLQFYNNSFSLAHIGDSRCYRVRAGKFEQITKDHSLLQELIDRGFYTPEEAKESLNKNLVTRAMGIDNTVQPDLQEEMVKPDDLYLLCSDGLSDLVEDEEIHLTLSKSGANLQEAAGNLVHMANEKGGKDNISVILARILEPFPARRSWYARLFDWF